MKPVTTSSSGRARSTRSAAATTTTGSRAAAATRRSTATLGNDVIVWNNGEGDDINIGGGGVDETLIVTGTGDDNMTVAPNGARIRIERGFKVDMETVERLSITSFSGNDTLTTQPGITLPMTIDAGSGNDTITTGDGADLINGGDGNDTLNGAGGGDRIVGDRGGDTMNGGAGDDTTVWNNGDGSDVMNGDDGVDRVETNLSAGADTSTLKLENGRVRYDRLNPGPFNLSIATAEVFELNTLGGDDTLTTATDVTLPLVVDAGAGNDTIQGGAASDSIDGGDGNDTVQLREGIADFVRGGLGADQATVDAIDAVAADVESVDRPQRQPAPRSGGRRAGQDCGVNGNVASREDLLPGRRQRVQGHRDAAHRQGPREDARQGELHAEGGRDQDAQDQARQGHGQAGQEQEAGRQGSRDQRRRRREDREPDAALPLAREFARRHAALRGVSELAQASPSGRCDRLL